MILSDNETKFDLLNNEAIAKTVQKSMVNVICGRIFFSINPKMLKTKSGINLIHKIPPNRILIETDAPFSGEFKNAKQLKNILQDMIDNISMIKGIDLKKYLIHNEETVFAY